MMRRFLLRVRAWLGRWFRIGLRPELPCEIREARKLISAVDAGGVPLNPARINQIAMNLGLEVSRKAPQEETIQRIRAAVERADSAVGGRV